jgi:alkanesulfonate monooxygenase
VTERIEIIAAVKPALFHPAVLAKMATQIEEISEGRFAINLVNAWFKPEFERAGIPFAPHDARYAYGAEWLRIFRALSAGETLRFAGEHFRIDGYKLRPAARFRPRPLIYAGGESGPARDLAAEAADVWFMNGQSLEQVRALIADVGARPRVGAPLRYAMSSFVIARPTDVEAEAAHAAAMELAMQDAPLLARTLAQADAANVMFRPLGSGEAPQVGTNGGTAAGLVGSYDTVAARIAAFGRAGVELFMLQFQPFEAEMERFAAEVRPRLTHLLA